jgi:hypothetical protein
MASTLIPRASRKKPRADLKVRASPSGARAAYHMESPQTVTKYKEPIMISRWIRVGALLLSCLMSTIAAIAQEHGSSAEAYTAMVLSTSERAAQALPLKTLLASLREGRVCNGGVCSTGFGTLNCPSSGAPPCTESQLCACICGKVGDTWIAYNSCIDP